MFDTDTASWSVYTDIDLIPYFIVNPAVVEVTISLFTT